VNSARFGVFAVGGGYGPEDVLPEEAALSAVCVLYLFKERVLSWSEYLALEVLVMMRWDLRTSKVDSGDLVVWEVSVGDV